MIMGEAIPQLWWAFAILGLCCGVFGATFGVGGGVIMVPALVLIFSLPQKSAQGVALAVMVPMALVASSRYIMNPAIKVDLVIVGILAAGAVVGGVIGAGIAAWAPALILRKLFAIIMIATAVRMLIK
jgi:hypothetical protein